jgi:transcription elongation factor GreA
MNSETISTLVAKNPSLKTAKAKLEAMEPGSYCLHKSWGFGQIRSYDEAAGKLLIDFTTKPGHAMDPAFCVNTLDILPPQHLLVRKATEPAKLQKLVSEDPAQLLIDALAAYPNSAATQIEIEIVFAQVLGEEKFKKWWSTAKKTIAKDPRIGVPAKKTECYFLRETPVSNEDEIAEKFTATRSARLRVKLAQELLDAADKNQTPPKTDLAALLAGLTEAVKSSNQFTLADRLHAASIRDRLAVRAEADVATLEPSQVSLVANVRDLPGIVEKLPVSFQGDFLALLKEAHPVEYRDIVIGLLKNSQGKFTTECINFLVEHDHAEEIAATFRRWMTEQNLLAPVLHWIVKNRDSKKFKVILDGLVTPRLLTAIFNAIDREALQSSSSRRIPLADSLSEDADLIPELLRTASAETARDLAHALLLNQGFEDLTKKSLLARFIKLFPSIATVLTGDNDAREEQLLVSRESYERKREELEAIISQKIPDNSKAIAAAREHGDLKENSEYKMAKQDQAVLMAQKAQLEKDLGRARITDFKEANLELVGVGNIVEVRLSSSGANARYTLLGAWDSVPEQNIIAYKTPLGQALLGKKAGDTVKVKIGAVEESYTIVSLARYAA